MITALHGAVGSEKDWENIALQSEAIRGLNLWDLLAEGSLSLQDAGKKINQKAHAEDKVLMGYSMGGRIALHALLEENAPWEKAIIISAHTGLGSEEEKTKRRTNDLLWEQKAKELPWEEFLHEWNAQSILPNCQLPDRKELEPYKLQIARSFIHWSTGQQENLLSKLSQINIPVLWVTGETDTKFTNIGAKVSERIPNFQHVVIPHCGHRVPWEQPVAFAAEVDGFLSD